MFTCVMIKNMRILAYMAGLSLTASQAGAAITVTDARIAGGRLIVSGTSDTGDYVSLDGYYTTEVANKAFAFSIVYIPASCVISVAAPGTTAPNIRAAVANCAPMSVNPMGVWNPEIHYRPNDLVEREKGQYVALANARPNVNEDPLTAASFWRPVPMPQSSAESVILIGPKGERGEAGAAGRDGAKGDKGEDGLLSQYEFYTIKADLTLPSVENGQPKSNWKVTSSGSLEVSIADDDHDPYADLRIDAKFISDLDSCTFAGTVFDGNPDKPQGGFGRLKKRGDTIVLPVRTVGEATRIEAFLLCPKAR